MSVISLCRRRADAADSDEGRSAALERVRWAIRAKQMAEAALAVDRRSAYRGAARHVRTLAKGPLKGLPEIVTLAAMLQDRADRFDVRPARRRAQTFDGLLRALNRLESLHVHTGGDR